MWLVVWGSVEKEVEGRDGCLSVFSHFECLNRVPYAIARLDRLYWVFLNSLCPVKNFYIPSFNISPIDFSLSAGKERMNVSDPVPLRSKVLRGCWGIIGPGNWEKEVLYKYLHR